MRNGVSKMSWFIPSLVSKFVPSKRATLIDRMFEAQYTKFEFQQITEFSLSRKKSEVEISGYVSWYDNQYFLLLPAKTTSSKYIICKVQEGLKYPANNQYVICKGKWQYELESSKSRFGHNVLMIENIVPTKPEIDTVKPNISQKDFEEIIFENWINIDETSQNLIAQGLVSSPTTSTRAGGLTLSLFRLPAQRSLSDLLKYDLRRSIPPEIYHDRPSLFEIREFGVQHKMPSYGWSEIMSDFDEAPKSFNSKLARIPATNEEYSISLFSQKSMPDDLNSQASVKSDYPIVLEELIERRKNLSDPDPEIYKYLISVHMSSPTVSTKIFKEAIDYSREELKNLAEVNESLSKYMGHNAFLDLSINGKPLSVMNFALSRTRSSMSNSISLEDVKHATNDYKKNLEHVIDVWEGDLLSSKIPRSASLNFDERKILNFLLEKGPSTITEIATSLKITIYECEKIMRSLDLKKIIYMHDSERYGTTIF